MAAILLSLTVAGCGNTGSSPNARSMAVPDAPAPAEVYAVGTGAGGVLQIGDQTHEMRYAYVSDVTTIPELRYANWPDRVLYIVVSDRPVDPDNAYVNGLTISGWGSRDNYVGVVVTVDPETQMAMNGIAVLPFDPMQMMFVDQIVRESGVRFTPETGPDGSVFGVLTSTQPIGRGPGGYSFEVAIGTDNVVVSAPQAILEGDAARASPQAAVYMAYIDALTGKDAVAMSAVTTNLHPKTIAPGDELLKHMVPDAPLPESITKIYVYEAEAVIWVSSTTGPDQFYQLQLVDGRWLVAPFLLQRE